MDTRTTDIWASVHSVLSDDGNIMQDMAANAPGEEDGGSSGKLWAIIISLTMFAVFVLVASGCMIWTNCLRKLRGGAIRPRARLSRKGQRSEPVRTPLKHDLINMADLDSLRVGYDTYLAQETDSASRSSSESADDNFHISIPDVYVVEPQAACSPYHLAWTTPMHFEGKMRGRISASVVTSLNKHSLFHPDFSISEESAVQESGIGKSCSFPDGLENDFNNNYSFSKSDLKDYHATFDIDMESSYASSGKCSISDQGQTDSCSDRNSFNGTTDIMHPRVGCSVRSSSDVFTSNMSAEITSEFCCKLPDFTSSRLSTPKTPIKHLGLRRAYSEDPSLYTTPQWQLIGLHNMNSSLNSNHSEVRSVRSLDESLMWDSFPFRATEDTLAWDDFPLEGCQEKQPVYDVNHNDLNYMSISVVDHSFEELAL